MSIDRFRAMEVFTLVVDLGSFSAAAIALGLPKGRVSTIVSDLESHLGVRLLNRTTRRLSLTEDGTLYYQRASAMLQDVRDLESGLQRTSHAAAGRLRVDVPAAAGRHVLAPALPDFLKRYPDLVLDIGSTDRPVDLVAEGVDCVIRGGEVHDETLVARTIGAMPVVTCAAPEYLRAAGVPATLEDLERHVFVNFFSAKSGRIFPFEFERDGVKRLVNRPHRVAANDADTYIAAGLAGMGLMQSPCSRAVAAHIISGRLVLVMRDWNAGALPMSFMYPKNRFVTAKLFVFRDWVMELFQKEFKDASACLEA